MKKRSIKAERERLAQVKLRKMARRIPDNAALINILIQFDRPFQRDLYYRLRPFLRFEAVTLEVVNGV